MSKGASLWGVPLFTLAVSFSVAGATNPARTQASQAESLCYAFLRDGDLLLTCDGRTEQITHFDDVEDFAVAPRQGTLVLIRHRRTPQGQAVDWVLGGKPHYFVSYSAMQAIELTTGKGSPLSPLQSPTRLETSCGTVLSITWDPTIGNRLGLAHDALTGERVRFDPYKNFRCSSDRRTIVGWSDPEHSVLMAGLPPQRELLKNSRSDELRYDVSPDGRFVVYNTRGKLCLTSEAGETECIEEGFDQGRISISDSKGVLIESGSDRACHYRDYYHFSVEPHPGHTEDDFCAAIAYWHPGEKRSTIVQPLGRSPQWVSPEAASALRAWGTHPRASQKAGP